MPRGFCPTFSVQTTLSVAVSITEIVAEPSLETYAKGAASPSGAPHRVNAQLKTIAAVERCDIQVSVSSTRWQLQMRTSYKPFDYRFRARMRLFVRGLPTVSDSPVVESAARSDVVSSLCRKRGIGRHAGGGHP